MSCFVTLVVKYAENLLKILQVKSGVRNALVFIQQRVAKYNFAKARALKHWNVARGKARYGQDRSDPSNGPIFLKAVNIIIELTYLTFFRTFLAPRRVCSVVTDS